MAYGQSSRPYIDGEVIVKMRDQVGEDAGDGRSLNRERLLKGNAFVERAKTKHQLLLKSAFHKLGVFHFQLKAGESVEQAIQSIKVDPDVEYVEPNYVFQKANVGGRIQSFTIAEVGSMSSATTYLATSAPIQVTSTWPTVTQNAVPVIAVIDTGLDIDHPVISGTNALWENSGETGTDIHGNDKAINGKDDDGNGYIDDVNGWNFISNSEHMIDDDGHGTHVSGIILSVTQNIYTAPYAPAIIRIMPLKFLDEDGYGRTSDAIKAIYYAVNNGATVLNNSWGGPSYSAALHEAITYAYNHGVLFVAAAGNNGNSNDSSPMYPASYKVPNVLAIAATTDSDAFANFSNFGEKSVHMASPGVYILSLVPGTSFATMSGTSMAAPFAAGLAALMKVEKPDLLPYQMKQIILASSDVLLNGAQHVLAGKVSSEGRINVYNTIQATKSASVQTTQPAYSFSNEDRELASIVAASGCGLVAKMMSGEGGGPTGGVPESWSVMIIIGLMSLPFLIYSMLRQKERQAHRRRHERFKINSEVKVSVGDRELVGSISTISLGGAQINTNALIDQGGIISMTIRSPDGKEQITVEGRVVWSEKQKAYGVQFAETSRSIKEKITNWTASLVKAS